MHVDGTTQLKLGDKEGEVLEREEQARAADVRVEERWLIHGRRGAVGTQAGVDRALSDEASQRALLVKGVVRVCVRLTVCVCG